MAMLNVKNVGWRETSTEDDEGDIDLSYEVFADCDDDKRYILKLSLAQLSTMTNKRAEDLCQKVRDKGYITLEHWKLAEEQEVKVVSVPQLERVDYNDVLALAAHLSIL